MTDRERLDRAWGYARTAHASGGTLTRAEWFAKHADIVLEMAERALEAEAECEEQARLNGMGAQREAKLLAQVARYREVLEQARKIASELYELGPDMRKADRRMLTHCMWCDAWQDTRSCRHFLTAGGKTLDEVAATGCWECHDWSNCPTHAAQRGGLDCEAAGAAAAGSEPVHRVVRFQGGPRAEGEPDAGSAGSRGSEERGGPDAVRPENCDHLERGWCWDCVEKMKSDAAYERDEKRYEDVQKALLLVRDGYNGKSARSIVMQCCAAAAQVFAGSEP